MVTAHSSKETDEVPTPEALIEMLRKQAFDLGEIGLTSTLKPQDTLQSIRTDDVRSGDSNRYAFSVASAMREGEQEQAHCRHVQNVIENTLGHHSSVYRKADAIVNRRLLAAGTDPKLVDLWSNIRGILRPKVVKLYRLENPLPELPKRVKVTLLRQCEKRTDRKDVYLSVADTLDGIHAALRSVSATIDGTGQLITSRGQGPWMYQFIDRHSILSSERRTLETDADYQYLMSEMTKPESTRTSACIFQVGRAFNGMGVSVDCSRIRNPPLLSSKTSRRPGRKKS